MSFSIIPWVNTTLIPPPSSPPTGMLITTLLTPESRICRGGTPVPALEVTCQVRATAPVGRSPPGEHYLGILSDHPQVCDYLGVSCIHSLARRVRKVSVTAETLRRYDVARIGIETFRRIRFDWYDWMVMSRPTARGKSAASMLLNGKSGRRSPQVLVGRGICSWAGGEEIRRDLRIAHRRHKVLLGNPVRDGSVPIVASCRRSVRTVQVGNSLEKNAVPSRGACFRNG